MIYAVGSTILVAIVLSWVLRLFDKLLPGVFMCTYGRPYGEPVLLASAFIFDYFVGRNGFTMWMGWWFFLYVLVSVPWHVYGNTLVHLHGEKYCQEHYPNFTEWRSSHRTFVFFIYFATFLYFWWKWI